MTDASDSSVRTEGLEELRAIVEAELERRLPPPESTPEVLREPMRYSLVAGGKRIRPILVLLACRACGGRDDEALPAACALEMIHTYSLIHDDLPAMDDDDLRRGKPTNHRVYGEASAILAGDALLTHAFAVLASDTPRRDRIPAMVQVLAHAAGPNGMVGGQALDLAAEGGETSPEHLVEIHELKTAALFAAATRLGAEAAGAEPATANALERYGKHLGLAFQAIDDVLDVESSSDVLGKTAGKDERQAKLTSTVVHGVDGAREEAARQSRLALDVISGIAGASTLVDLTEQLMERIA